MTDLRESEVCKKRIQSVIDDYITLTAGWVSSSEVDKAMPIPLSDRRVLLGDSCCAGRGGPQLFPESK